MTKTKCDCGATTSPVPIIFDEPYPSWCPNCGAIFHSDDDEGLRPAISDLELARQKRLTRRPPID
jgi:hypothetical protein